MSNLSNLLNPTPPTAESNASPKAQQPPPLQLDGRDHRSHHNHEADFDHAQSPIRHTVTSPGLDVLAAAASSVTAPLDPPIQQSSNTTQAMDEDRNESSVRLASQSNMSMGGPAVSHSGQEQLNSAYPPNHQLDSDRDMAFRPVYGGNSIQQPSPSTQPLISQSHDSLMGNTSTIPSTAPDSSLSIQAPHSVLTQISQAAAESPLDHAEQVNVKAESTDSPDVEMKDGPTPLLHASTPIQRDPTPGTPLKNVMSNTSPPALSQEDSSATPAKPKTGPPKKRAAPKKGTAVKPPAKKRKIENESGKASPRTGTPATSRASGTPAPKRGKQESATPTRSSSVANPDDDDDDGELELFCICRKPDDHTVMIGCDGPCEDWFHTRCVNMTNEKVALISKWYCPNCAADGHETEWKRMCRLEGCSNPARVEGPQRSKYCSNEHGQEFMRRSLSLNEKKTVGTNSNKKRRRDNYTDHDGYAVDGQEESTDNRGGVLRPGELKALVDQAKDSTTFKKLGDGVLSPPATAATSPGHELEKKTPYSPEETDLLERIAKKRADIESRKAMLNDRAVLVSLVDLRRKAVLSKLKEKDKSLKDICGYDARLAWSDDELNEWRASTDGRAQLDTGALEAEPQLLAEAKDDPGDDAEIGPGACKKKRCERHRTWYKTQQQDLAMEYEDVRQLLTKLEEEAQSVRDRAMIRSLEDGP